MNKIVDENAIVAGRAPSSYWDVEHSNQIEGFTTDISVDAGSRIDFKINVNGGAGSDYKVEVFRLGYYGGSGAREVAEWTNTDAKVQPQALFDASRGMADAGNWSVTDSWDVPDDAVSGVYLARLQRLDATGNPIAGATNQVPFIIRNDGEHHDIVLQTSDTTWQAYNGWAGNNGQVGANLYGDPSGRVDWDPIPGAGAFSQDRAYAVSYNRPFITDNGTSAASGAQDYLFGADYAAIFWLEKNGYDVSYISGVDTDRMGANYLTNYRAYISVGHDEYWSGGQRANVEAARDAGVNLLFWSGNECYWKTRWETATSADGTPYRTLVCYKETLAVADANAGPSDYYNLDPTNTWTGTWRDTRFHGNPLAGGGNPQDVDPITGLNPSCHCGENLLTGQLFGPDGTGQFGGALDVPASFAGLRMWRDTTVANGGKLDIAPGILGYEWDTSPDNLQRPAGLIKLSDTTIPWNGILVDQGNTVAPGSATHNLSLYRAPSGALVFGAGTTFWSWGLSNEHDSSPYGAQIENTDIKQFTINMFADMGIQPGVADAVLASQGLTRASASNDTHAATTSIDNLGQVAALSPVTITGTATDNDGNAATVDGKVAVVEVSLDGGNTWHVADTANGWSTWSFDWQPSATGNYTIRARAIDDSLNVSNIVADTETVTVTAPNAYSLFNATTPGNAIVANDGASIELGMRFSVDRVGTATELKYWRSSQDAADTDVRQGHLWRADGTLLATVTFTSAPGESGWQTATLSNPVGLVPGVAYVVSYRTANNYVATNDFFSDAHDVSFDGLNNDSFWGPFGVIRAAQDGVGGGNGLYVYGSGAAAMPTQTYNASNYWVDLTFDPTESAGNRPPSFTSAASFTRPENNTTVGIVSATDPDGNALAYAIAGGTDAARFSINASTGVLSFLTSPNFEAPSDADANNVYQLNVSVSDGLAAPVTQAVQVTVTDVNESGAMSHLFGASGTPATIKTDDPTDYELGAKFQSNTAGWISALYYYRGGADAGDVDVRTLNLWTTAGVKLGQVTVTSDQGASGWQAGTLNTPIAIQANTTYVVSYGTTQNYAFTANYFATAQAGPDGVLTGLSSGASGGNGVFANGTPGAFPTSTYQSANYWVDVGFVSALGNAPVITSPASFNMAENLTLAGTVTATDADGDALTYTLVGGADQARFTINATTGVLSFLTAPNFEVPTDVGANNVYNVTIAASDGKLPAVQQAVAVTVNNAVEPNQLPTISPIVAPTTNEDAAAVQINLLAGASDPDNDPVTVLTPIMVTSSNSSRTVAFTLSAAGVLTLNPAQFGDLTAGQSEVVTVSYMITDGVPVDASGVSNTATITVQGRNDAGQTITGTSASNTLIGGDGADTISGLGGNDSLQGNGGADTLDGGSGTDNVNGGTGDDVIIVRGTEAQGDTMTGGAGTDTLRIAGTANLVLSGTNLITGIETLDGGGRSLSGTSAANVIDLSGFTTVTNLASVLGLAGNDTLTGGSGNDTLDGGAGVDTVRGGGGGDGIIVRGTEAQGDTMTGGTGIDTLRITGTADLTLNGTNLVSEIEVLDGAGRSLRGTNGVNVLDLSGFATVTNLASVLGLGGNDTLIGGSGNDILNGGSGVDTVRGGGGNDTILVRGSEASTDTMDGGTGQDRILVIAAGGSFALSGTSRLAGIEQFDGAGIDIRGSSAADTFDFSGISLLNVSALNGLGGSDTLRGSAGTDNVDGGDGNDLIIVRGTEAQSDTMTGGAGTDTLRIVGTANLVLSGTNQITGIETLDGGGRSLSGTSAANVIDLSGFTTVTNLASVLGLAGNDTLTGGSGNETLDGGTGVDTVRGGGGDDTILVSGNQATTDTMDGGAGQDRVLVSAAGVNFTLSGTSRLSNIEQINGSGVAIQGSSGADTFDFSGISLVSVSAILGLGGADTLIGSAGDDIMTGGTSNDIFVFRLGQTTGNDLITDFDASGNDVIRLAGYSPSVNLSGATDFDADGVDALIHLADLGGDGSIRLTGVTEQSFTTEDFVFA